MRYRESLEANKDVMAHPNDLAPERWHRLL